MNSDEDLMKNDDFNVFPQAEPLSRRRMLSFLGVAGLSTSCGALASEAGVGPQSAKAIFRIYSCVGEMKQDRSIKVADYIKTFGYHAVDDGGHATYQVVQQADQQVDEGEYVRLHADLLAKLINVKSVNYKMFGAKADGENDDGMQIKSAHDYANKYNIPVNNPSGDFWIKRANNISIQTNVQWGNTKFHIDERYNSTTPRFSVRGRQESKAAVLSSKDKKAVLEGLKNKDTTIPALARYVNSLAVIVDANDNFGARYSGSSQARVRKKRDFFIIEEHGRILGDVLDFNDYTSLTIYPAETSYLVVEGGVFLLSGHNSELMDKGYMHHGIQVTRSRTIIKNQWVGLESGQKDTAMLARHGFYSFLRAFDVQLKNIRQIPYEKTRATAETTLSQGTYGISCNTVMNTLFSNVTAEGGRVHWGVFGTNYVKNIWIERCYFNRFDIHSFGWNVYIKDSHIGEKGITVTGGGDLRVENSSCRGKNFVSFRPDYGSRWDGDITIKDCRYYAAGNTTDALLRYGSRDRDYHYNIGHGRRITVENVEIDYENKSDSDTVCWLISLPVIKSYKNSGKLFFPDHILLKNISLKGRRRGMRIMQIPPANSYVLRQNFINDGSFLATNGTIVLENIQQLEESTEQEDAAHFSIDKAQHTLEENSLVPLVKVKNCRGIRLDMGGNLGEVVFEESIIDHLVLGGDDLYDGLVRFSNCMFRPSRINGQVLRLNSVLGTSFINCQLFLPHHKEAISDPLSYYGFMEVNNKLQCNHLGTRLGKDILAYFKNKGVKLTPEFLGMLKAHYDLEA